MLFWQSPSCLLSRWSLSISVDGVSHSCAEQYMIAEKALLFQDEGAVGLITPSPDPRAHKRIGRSVWVISTPLFRIGSGKTAPFTHEIAAMKQHILSTTTNGMAEASPRDPLWGWVFGQTTPSPRLRRWGGKQLFGIAFSGVRDAIRTIEAGLAHPVSSHYFCTSTSSDGNHEMTAAWPFGSSPRLPGSSVGFFGLFF